MDSNYIIHAVTMKYPGTKSNFNTIEKLFLKVLNQAYILGCKTISIQLLGAGVGGLS